MARISRKMHVVSTANDDTGALPTYGIEEKTRGAVFTKTSIVEFMLDLVGYTVEKPLYEFRLLEPSFGGGRFILGAVDRLLDSWLRSNRSDPLELLDSVRAIEIDQQTYESFSITLQEHLVQRGIPETAALLLVGAWLQREDFLLADIAGDFDFVIGNPPYVRQEHIPKDLLRLYRKKYPTMVGRADLYIAFMERSLDLLDDGGKLCFICADAWVRNDYGRGIRGKISSNYSLTHYIDMYGLDAFEVSVGAYPSITVISKSASTLTRVVHAKRVETKYLEELAGNLLKKTPPHDEIVELAATRGSEPWLLSANPGVAIVSDLESRFPTLIEARCRVGIGVATGADRIYIGESDELDVEDDRKLPLATNKDVLGGVLKWNGKWVINPWNEDGSLVQLADYPRLETYLTSHKDRLSRRHTAKAGGGSKWYKTIDRIMPGLLEEPKLLIPDIKGDGDSIAYDPGTLYPHHNLYFITSESWDLRALQALLRSGIAELFVSAYSVKLGGGYLRFQAQNLKRIRIPFWEEIDEEAREEMHSAGEKGEKLSTELLERIYKLEPGTLRSI